MVWLAYTWILLKILTNRCRPYCWVICTNHTANTAVCPIGWPWLHALLLLTSLHTYFLLNYWQVRWTLIGTTRVLFNCAAQYLMIRITLYIINWLSNTSVGWYFTNIHIIEYEALRITTTFVIRLTLGHVTISEYLIICWLVTVTSEVPLGSRDHWAISFGWWLNRF